MYSIIDANGETLTEGLTFSLGATGVAQRLAEQHGDVVYLVADGSEQDGEPFYPVTDEQIEELLTEAAAAGDVGGVALCGFALDGASYARAWCAQTIAEAK